MTRRSSAFSRFRTCAGLRSSSQTRRLASVSRARHPASSSFPRLRKFPGWTETRRWCRRPVTTAPAVSASRASSSRVSSCSSVGGKPTRTARSGAVAWLEGGWRGLVGSSAKTWFLSFDSPASRADANAAAPFAEVYLRPPGFGQSVPQAGGSWLSVRTHRAGSEDPGRFAAPARGPTARPAARPFAGGTRNAERPGPGAFRSGAHPRHPGPELSGGSAGGRRADPTAAGASRAPAGRD